MAKKAVIAGSRGLVGNSLLNVLLHKPGYDEVLILVRKQLPVKNIKLKQLIVDFDKLDDYADQITGDALFSCLGSTKKKTPDLAEYRKIDHDYTVNLARIAKKNKIQQFHLVSSIGANAGARNFYSKMKGETEDDVIGLGLADVQIYRPSVLVGNRTERRPLERFFAITIKVLNKLLFGSLKKYNSIPGTMVARAMYKQSLKNEKGVYIHSSDKIKELS